MRSTNRYSNWVAVATLWCIVMFNNGCNAADDKGKSLTWKQMESVLSSKDVRTVEDLFRGIAALDVSERTKEFYRNVEARVADHHTFGKYFAEAFQQTAYIEEGKKHGKDMSERAVRERLTKLIQWKATGASLHDVARVYTKTAYPATRSEDFSTWGRLVYFEIYTDDRGRILGWRNTSKGSVLD